MVDLETTGGSAQTDAITEVGAVRVRGGVREAEFATLVNPAVPIPPFIAALTGIRDAMVAGAPRIDSVLPAFLEFARGAVLVAHNARFDVGFLRTESVRLGVEWPAPPVLDTVALARHVLPRGEVPNHRLATLARHVSSPTTPNHRALQDARATVDVLHALLERVGNLGVRTWEDLREYTRRVPAARRRRRHLAEGLPHLPGVYYFVGPQREVLYVGTSRDLASRVRSYFTRAQTRARIDDMLHLAESVTPIVCQTRLEAQVREVRLIAEHQPRFNRRSRHPERAPWLKLTDEAYPRFSVVRERRPDGALYLGPFTSRSGAEDALAAMLAAVPLRQCTRRLPVKPSAGASACILADLGRCLAPCIVPGLAQEYSALVDQSRHLVLADAGPVHRAAEQRMARFSEQQRFEEAGRERDRLRSFLHAADRTQRRDALVACPELVAARRNVPVGGWELVVLRFGRLAGTCCSPPGADPMVYVRTLQSTAEEVAAPEPGMLAALPEETHLVEAWLSAPGVRLVELTGEWACPVGGAGRLRQERPR